jgi:poly-gamma-glutamate synthesis protein (capsule biosynthesis protein)
VLKDLKFFKGNKLCYHTTPNKEDMERVKKAIYEAQMGADYIIVSVHSHEVGGDSKENPAPFLVEFAHQCIDSGAHAVIGHGPHLIRPLEIYKGYPIFYSLGDFMLHNESISKVPEDMYEKYALNSDTTLRELFCKRSANYTRGLMTDHRMFESFIPYFEMEGGKLTHLELLPIELDFEEPRYKNGNPHVSTDHCILERLKEMSAPYGTEIEIDERGIGIVKLT